MINWCNHPKVCRAATLLQNEGVVAYPTEAVWGLGCDPWSEAAVGKILRLKRRAEAKGLILIASHIDQFDPFLQGLDEDHRARMLADYSKPITWLVPDNGTAPDWIVGEHSTVALRITAHPVAAALCTLFAGPLVSTSANPQGLPAAINGLKVKSYFGQGIDYLAPGAVGSSRQASEIRNLITSEVIRPG
ncbi:Sua5/YciO/YrdC/YwlC family protein [Porticoccaceae bacterium]|nr:Sua5/YciO/YrdC/YwlC family protein [Porticoccaceae bacterium]